MHATDADEKRPGAAAEEQEAPMFTHPDTVITFADLHREDLHTTAARERRAVTVVAPAFP